MKAKPLEFKKLAKGFYQAPTIDGSYCVYEPKTFSGVDAQWAMRHRSDEGVFGATLLRDSLELAEARCEELHQQAWDELVEYWCSL
jgi:hypothetical protein